MLRGFTSSGSARLFSQAYAERLGLGKQLVIVRGDKPKTKAKNCKFGFANGINTGGARYVAECSVV
jgi:hypothetical protein